MCRDEIEWNVVFRSLGDEFVDPSGLRGGGTADSQFCIYAFHCFGSFVVEHKVGGLFRFAVPEIDVRFIPNFEVPLLHLILSVTVNQVFYKGSDQSVPLGRVLGRRREWFIPEWMRREIGCQFTRHEA